MTPAWSARGGLRFGREEPGRPLLYAEQSTGQELAAKAGRSPPARRGLGSAPGKPRRGVLGGASAATPLAQVANGRGGAG